jgi:protein gp37
MPNDLTAGENIVRLGGIGLSPDKGEEDNAANATPADAGKTEANIVRLMTPAQCRVHAQGMQSEQIAEYVVKNGWVDVLVRLKQLKPYLEVLWDRFDDLKGTETIAGCRTKAEFCNKRLHRSIRAVQYMLYGRTPEKADSDRSGRQPKAGQDEVVLDADNDATLPAEAADGAVLEEPTVLRFAHGRNPAANGAAQSREESLRPGHDEEDEEKKVVGNVIPVPQPASDPVPDPDPGTMEALRQRLSPMTNTGKINKALETFFKGLAQSLLEHNPWVVSSTISVQVSVRIQRRINEGDWVKDTYSANQAGQNEMLGRVLGKGKGGRPKVRWHNGQKWTKPFSLEDLHAPYVCVLSAAQAAEQFPEAYGSYPVETIVKPQGRAKKSRKHRLQHDESYNFWKHCHKFSEGCKSCSMSLEEARRRNDPEDIRRCIPTHWKKPLKWQRDAAAAGVLKSVFACSYSDFFMAEADEWREDAWKIIKATPNLIWQLASKRTHLIAERLPADWGDGYPNVWLGTSVELKKHLGRLDDLRKIPCRMRWLDFAPLLEDIMPDLASYLEGFGWVNVSGEQGCKQIEPRPFDPQWARNIRDLCKERGIPFHHPQGGGKYGKAYPLLDGVRHFAAPPLLQEAKHDS